MDDSDEEFKPKPKKIPKINIESLALITDRYGISERVSGAIATTAISCIDISDSAPIIDRFKIRRAREKLRKKLSASSFNNEFFCLAFDGRKDDTLNISEINGRHYKNIIKEEHIVMLSEPGSNYIGHVSPKSSHSDVISGEIIKYFTDKRENLNIDGVLCDGCPTNIGVRNGIIKKLEIELKRPLQWLICQLHMNELPFTNLFKNLDGPTISDVGFAGKKINI